MRNTRLNNFIIAAGLAALLALATSCGANSPVEPLAGEQTSLGVSLELAGSHHTAGVWQFVIEPGRGIVDAIPVRTVEGHYNITQVALDGKSCPGCITFQFGNLNAGGQQDVTVTVTNKYIGKIPGYDLKGIILAEMGNDPAAPYQSPWYLINADDYTNLYLKPGTSRYPFKAFDPGDAERKLDLNESSTLTFKLMFPPSPVDWSRITAGWALDACEVNCPEPYAIENQAVSGGTVPVLGEPAQVTVDVRDHQGDAKAVILNVAPIGGGSVSLAKQSGDQWAGSISASDATSPGTYTLQITATDSIETAVKIYDDLVVTVGLTDAQNAMYDKLKGVMDDWDDDQLDCVVDELADGWGIDSAAVDSLMDKYINDIQTLLESGDTGDLLKWKVLRTTKDLVKALAGKGVTTTMSEFIDALREALDACLAGHQGWGGSSHNLCPGVCSLDIGVIGGGALKGHVLFTDNSPNCNEVWIYKPDYSSWWKYKSLVNLDPANPLFQPYPVVRLDATNDGAFSWTNSNYDYYQAPEHGNVPVRISSIWCTDDNVPSFHPIPLDDSRVFPVPPPPQASQFRPVDVCDDFDLLQYALVIDPTMIIPPHVWGHRGAPQGKDYTKSDDRYGAFFNMAQIGPGDGQIEAGLGDTAGIDVWNKSSNTAWLFVAEKGGQWAVEVFEIKDLGAGLGVDTITSKYTIHFSTQPLDIELLPVNSSYEKNPDVPAVAVLLRSADGTGYISLHRADNGALIETVGSAQAGCFEALPAYLDVNDAACEIHVSLTNATVRVFSLQQIPGS